MADTRHKPVRMHIEQHVHSIRMWHSFSAILAYSRNTLSSALVVSHLHYSITIFLREAKRATPFISFDITVG